jgi:hypothetical protein
LGCYTDRQRGDVISPIRLKHLGWGGGYTDAYTEKTARWSYKPFIFFFQNKENRINTGQLNYCRKE